MSTPTFSVVIPAHNAERTVLSTARSVLAQTRTDLEVIVVDDGSSDRTSDVVEKLEDERLRLLVLPHGGVSAARNAGIELARGKYVAFLDSDDLWLPRYLELAERAISDRDRAGFAYTDAYGFDPVSGRVGDRSMAGRYPPTPPPSSDDAFLLELLKRNFIWSSTTVPRTVLNQVGGFDEAAPPAEDYELWLRILVRGYSAAWIPGRHGLYRVHDRQASRQLEKVRRGERAALGRISFDDLPSSSHRTMLAAHRRQIERELRILEGRAPLAAAGRRVRRRLGTVRRRIGLGRNPWHEQPPQAVSAAFPNLTAV
jgi:glycosyltransferase involved in cell wall biosynthesis